MRFGGRWKLLGDTAYISPHFNDIVITPKQPFLVHHYNASMGGVDLFDRFLSSYRPGIRGKKWWSALFIHAINVTVVAAWRVHCQFQLSDSKSHLTFRRDIARTLMKTPPVLELPVPLVGPGPPIDSPAPPIRCKIEHLRGANKSNINA